MPLRTVFFGTQEFAVPILEALDGAGYRPLAVVCQPDRPKGRGLRTEPPAVKLWGAAHGVSVHQPETLKDEDFRAWFRASACELAWVAAYGLLIPKAVLSIPARGFANVHPSLLPRYRGAAPIQWTLIHGDPDSGVTILKVTPRLDDGDMLLQERLAVLPEENAEELSARLAQLGGRLAVQASRLWEHGDPPAQPQDDNQVIWARALEKDDGRIDWSRPSHEIANRIRGVHPWPGAFSHLDGKRIKFLRVRPESDPPVEAPPTGPVGQVWLGAQGQLWVRTGEGWLRLLELQPEGKKRMDAKAFLLGRGLAGGDILGCQ